ncbi:MAG: DUF2799 domain-containing protein [Mariprofundaceae bacterium]|nr:DUF2799 domain-containing protein [Mariprofundaceae bacterium]
MKRSLYLLSMLLMTGVISGCASMSKKECMNANWESVGYSDGARGVHNSQLEKHRQSCVEYQVIPDNAAYRSGWEQGIRRYCTADNGYRAGQSGRAYRNICPADVADDYISGWRQGIRRYCTPENGLRHGLAGQRYNGICPADLESAYHDLYRLGADVRTARAEHQKVERSVTRLEKRLAVEKSPDQHRKLLHQLERLQYQEAGSDAKLISLEACMESDWFDAGYRDGEDGYPRRSGEIAAACRGYGIAADQAGYRQGWRQGNRHYCTYETGLYLGQTNQRYSGVCAGQEHQHFWQGYERGRSIYRADRYEAHPKPVKKVVSKKAGPEKGRLPPRIKAEPARMAEPEQMQHEVHKTVPEKAVHDNRDREVQQPALHSRATEPAKKREKVLQEPHDNRDKLKHPMPARSQKQASKVKKDYDDDDEREEQEKEER